VLLVPLSFLWAGLSRGRRLLSTWSYRRRKLRVPVICVGNLHSGGSGKTPLVVALAEKLKDFSPVILSRGYRGDRSAAGAEVKASAESQRLSAKDFGEEAWMMAQQTRRPVFVGKNRVRSASMALASYPETSLILMDDGFQNFALHHDTDLVAIPVGRSPMEAFCLPYGELREPLGGLSSATAVVLTGVGAEGTWESQWRKILGEGFPKLPLFEARLKWAGLWEPDRASQRRLDWNPPGMKFAAFSGIGYPKGFRTLLEQQGICLERFLAYPDHEPYPKKRLQELDDLSQEMGLTYWITTAKDLPKVQDQLRVPVCVARINYELSEDFWYFLKTRLPAKGATS